MAEEIEVDIDQLLAGLRNTVASPGMEGRVLRAVESRGAAPRAWWRIRQLKAVSIFSVSLACAVSLAFFFLRPNQFAHPSARPQPIAVAATPQTSLPARVPSAPGPQPTQTTGHGNGVKPEAVKLEWTRRGNPPAEAAESYPAPPMPLTEQEKLLVRVAHRRDPANLAMLNPAAQATLIASEQAQFEKFFAPPPPPTQTEVKDEGPSR